MGELPRKSQPTGITHTQCGLIGGPCVLASGLELRRVWPVDAVLQAGLLAVGCRRVGQGLGIPVIGGFLCVES